MAERAFVATPIASGGGRVIASPFQFVTTGEDFLRVTSFNALTGVRLKIQFRRLNDCGGIDAGAWDHTPADDRTARTSDFALGVGALLNLAVFAQSAAPVHGQTFVLVQIVRGQGAAAIVLGTMLQGYVTAAQGLGWPGSPIQASTDGEGYVRVITGTNPAVAAEALETVPTGARWQLLGFFIALNTSAAAPARSPFLDIRLGGVRLFRSVPPLSIPASVGAFLSWGSGVAAVANATYSSFQSSTPAPLIIPAGGTIETATGGLDAADNYDAPQYSVREWLEVA